MCTLFFPHRFSLKFNSEIVIQSIWFALIKNQMNRDYLCSASVSIHAAEIRKANAFFVVVVSPGLNANANKNIVNHALVFCCCCCVCSLRRYQYQWQGEHLPLIYLCAWFFLYQEFRCSSIENYIKWNEFYSNVNCHRSSLVRFFYVAVLLFNHFRCKNKSNSFA